jgi:hypothetical protein
MQNQHYPEQQQWQEPQTSPQVSDPASGTSHNSQKSQDFMLIFMAVLCALIVWTLVMWGIFAIVQHSRQETQYQQDLFCSLSGTTC